ncbi:hypothetical protein D3C85_1765860 [compost metagenome]
MPADDLKRTVALAAQVNPTFCDVRIADVDSYLVMVNMTVAHFIAPLVGGLVRARWGRPIQVREATDSPKGRSTRYGRETRRRKN